MLCPVVKEVLVFFDLLNIFLPIIIGITSFKEYFGVMYREIIELVKVIDAIQMRLGIKKSLIPQSYANSHLGEVQQF